MIERLSGLQGALAMLDHRGPSRRPPRRPRQARRRAGHPWAGARPGDRLLHDDGSWDADEVSQRVGRALTPGTPAADGARFVEGFLAGSGTVLVHDAGLLGIVDTWISTMTNDVFVDTVALLRRTFGAFEPAERRQLGVLVTTTGSATTSPRFGSDVDDERAAAGIATVRVMLGLEASVSSWTSGRGCPTPSASAAGASCSAAATATARRLGSTATTAASTPPSARCTTTARSGPRGSTARGRRVGGLGRSAPAVSRWLGDIRRYFPVPVVQVLQRDAVERLDLTHLLLEPELLAELEPDVHLVSVLVELNRLLPEATKDTARQVIAGVLETMRQRFADRTRAAVAGALARTARQPSAAPRRRRLVAHDPRQPAPLASRSSAPSFRSA